MIPYSRQHITEEDIQAVTDVLRSDYLTTGPAITRFEEKLCEITGAAYAVSCANGTAALHLACLALGISSKDRCITSPLTFLASANCVEYCGGSVDFLDIDPATLCLSADALEAYCQAQRAPKAVIPVSYAGVPAGLPGIKKLSEKYGLKIIEDAAHSIGSTYTHEGKTYGSASCAHADLATLSFHPVKNITTGEGGAVTTNDAVLAKKLRLLRSHGMTKECPENAESPWYYSMAHPGFNYRLTDIQAALGLSQLSRLNQYKEARQSLARNYGLLLRDIPGIDTPPWPETTSPCFHLYPIRFDAGAKTRKKVYDTLLQNEIQSQVHYIPVHLQPYYREKYGYAEGKCPVAERFYQGCLSLPLFPGLSRTDQERIAGIIRSAL